LRTHGHTLLDLWHSLSKHTLLANFWLVAATLLLHLHSNVPSFLLAYTCAVVALANKSPNRNAQSIGIIDCV
jgi:hypothetical protein